jgi:hypothetical protein
MTAELQSRTWTYRQSCFGAELKFSTTAHQGGVYHSLSIVSHGAHKTFELNDDAIGALGAVPSNRSSKILNGSRSFQFHRSFRSFASRRAWTS